MTEYDTAHLPESILAALRKGLVGVWLLLSGVALVPDLRSFISAAWLYGLYCPVSVGMVLFGFVPFVWMAYQKFRLDSRFRPHESVINRLVVSTNTAARMWGGGLSIARGSDQLQQAKDILQTAGYPRQKGERSR